nr:hypothetical protein [Tanacetum cinerariifolium]
MEQHLALSRENQAPSMVKPEIEGNVNIEIKSLFMHELREDTFSGNKNEDAHDHVDRVLNIDLTLTKNALSTRKSNSWKRSSMERRSAPFNGTNGAKFCVGPPRYYTRTDNRPPYGEKRPSLEEVVQNAVQNPSIQIVENMNGLSVVSEIANQYGNKNVVTAPAGGNGDDINDRMQQNVMNQVVQNAVQNLDAFEETKRVKANYILENNLQLASTSGTQSNKALVSDSDRSVEAHLSKSCYDNDIFNMFTQKEQYT